MEEKIKVLILEDLPTDVELAEREVKSVLKNYTVVVTYTEKDFIEALENFEPDLVISDYKLPTFDGMKALQITRKKEEYIPFIILTGSMNEQTAVECMKAGADDYVIKEHIRRLGPAILGALDKRRIRLERKQAEEQLAESEKRYRLISSVAADYMFSTSLKDGKLVLNWVAGAFETITGYTMEEYVARGGWRAHLHPDDIAQDKRDMENLRAGRRVVTEIRTMTKSGEIRWVRVYAHPVLDEHDKNLIGIYGAVQDITERKQAEEALRQSRERLNHLFTVNPAIVYALDPENFSTTWVSPNVTEITGYTPEEASQPGWWTEHVHPEDREEMKKAQERLRVEDQLAHEYRFQKKDGRYIWVRDELRLLRDEQGRPKEIVGSWMNITDRKEAEKELAKSEQRYRSVFENTGTAMLIVNEDGSIAFANRQCTATTGYSPEKLQGTDWRGYVFADDLPMMENYFRLRFSDPAKAPNRYETRLIHADGSIRNALLTADIIPSTKQIVVSILDITERVQAQEALARASREWEEIFQAIGHPTLILSPRHTVLAANQAALKATGMKAEELVGKSCYEVFHGTSQPPDDCPMEVMLRSGRLETVEMEMEALGGTFLVSCTPVFDAQGELEKVIHIATDVTERVRAEEARRLLETAIDNAIECVMVSDRENRLTYVNRAFEKLTGYAAAEVLGKTAGILQSSQHDRDFYHKLKKTIYSGHPWQGNLILKKKNGDLYEVAATITPILNASGQIDYFVSVHRDVTKEREMERRIQQNQRLEAIGTLAGGIAHDFNNLLTPIVMYTEMCIDDLPAGSKVKENLEEVMQAAKRATGLVRQILSFSRRSDHDRKPLQMAPIIKEVLKLLRASIPVTIDIRQEITDTGESVIADPTEIHQVVVNLCTNAFHAMPEGGVLTVALKAVELDPDTCAVIPDCTPGRYLNLSVEDTGHGIAPEILDKIFEPYFTTKEAGRGTGLGLAVTHSIVAACGGAITVHSEPGKGTRFNLYFPVAEEKPTEVVEKATNIARGHESILFIDDEAAIVELGKRTLERYGYSVTASMDPVQALELFKKTPTEFDMVITDMTMPGMTGDLLAEAMLKIRPDLPVIVCTGFSERMNQEKAQKLGIRRLLIKPVSVNDLLSTIRDIFDAE